ncbi:MAG: tyrosine-type recombinase/integrase [Eggerthellaceae bacterium]|nr:tyrosine-type recombinase/integrase [Eggerthellaceae bacterium]
MDIREFEAFVPGVLERMRADGYSPGTVGTAEWVYGLFADYCKKEGVEQVDEDAAARFLLDRFGFEADEGYLAPPQCAIRKPLLNAFEVYRTGTYCRTHQQGAVHDVPEGMKPLYSLLITDFVSNQYDICENTKRRKIWVASRFLTFISESGVEDIGELTLGEVDAFLESQSHLASETVRCERGVLREMLDWLAARGLVGFTGQSALPPGCRGRRAYIPSCFTRDEVERMLGCIDRSTSQGKLRLAVMSLFAFTGIRVGDAQALDLGDILWDEGIIRIAQKKTGIPLDVPLVEEVRWPLADYIRNSRPDCPDDPDALFVTVRAPHRRMSSRSSFYRVICKCMGDAGVEPGNRHHGPHSLRHSLATNMLNADVPVSAISDVLGHRDVKSTEFYLSVDLSHSRDLALEVPL